MTTVFTEAQVRAQMADLLSWRKAEADRLDMIYQYLRTPERNRSGRPSVGPGTHGPLRWLNSSVPDEVRRLAEMSQVNMLRFVVDTTAQVMYVDGYRVPKESEEAPGWETWQLNRMDARQIAVHRSMLRYGVAYTTVLPGDFAPVIRGASPRKMTAVYGDDEDWPEYAVEKRRSAEKGVELYRIYDAANVFWVKVKDDKVVDVRSEQHGIGVCPVVRFIAKMDDDGVIEGEVEPLIPIQDQINVTTFGLLVAQHYGAFRQRYIMGWTAETESEAAVASARKLWTFEDDEVKVGEFAQTDLSGYINSREASLRHLATVSQTPAHELLGQLVNLSAEALAAAESGHQRKVLERTTSAGESWEQTLALASRVGGGSPDPQAQVRWRDTEARSLSQVADALGKLVLSLGIPPQELWDKIPGITQQEVERWKETAKTTDAIAQLNAVLDRQAQAQNPAGATGGDGGF